jgi:hypothetical protein
MSFYPQIGSGVVTQFPFSRTRMWRGITNQLEGGESIVLPDSAGGEIAWSLKYEDLTAAELQAIANLFAESQGGFGSFTFIDPLENLLGWSEDMTRTSWQPGQLTLASGAADPLGTTRASSLTNGTPGALSLSQTLGVSGDYVACFSAYIRSAAAGVVTIERDGIQTTASVGSQWRRIVVSGPGIAGAAQSTFSLSVPAGMTVQVFGLQVEVQPWPSTYRATGAASGIYEETYFADDELTVTSTAPGLSRASIKLISRI